MFRMAGVLIVKNGYLEFREPIHLVPLLWQLIGVL